MIYIRVNTSEQNIADDEELKYCGAFEYCWGCSFVLRLSQRLSSKPAMLLKFEVKIWKPVKLMNLFWSYRLCIVNNVSCYRRCHVPSIGGGGIEDQSEEVMEGDDQLSQDWCGAPCEDKLHEDDSLVHSTLPSMDGLLSECFYMAIKTSISKDDLPVLTSTFYRSHMMPLW